MSASLRKLQALLEFTDTDLNANRRGRLSKAQIEDLKATSTHELKALLVIPTLIVLLMMMYVSFMIALPAIIILGLIVTGLVALHRDHLKTYKDRKVLKLAGHLRKNPEKSQYGLAQYIVSIDDEQLPIDRHLFEALPEGKFTVYLLEKEQQILCMEPLRSSSSKSSSSTRKSTQGSKTKKTTTKSSTAKRRSSQPTKKTTSSANAKSRPKSKPKSTSTTKKSSSTSKKPLQARKSTITSSSTKRTSTSNTASITGSVPKQAKPKGAARPIQWTRTRETIDRH